MRRVIVNSTPLIALCNANLLFVLHELYGTIIIPKAVYDEVTAKTDSACAQISNNFDWIKTEFADDSADRSMYRAKLHAGEVEVMILAQQEPEADLVIIDDNAAKKTAKYLGLNVTGTIGVLLRAKKEKIIDSFTDSISKIEDNGFYIDEKLREYAVKQAGE